MSERRAIQRLQTVPGPPFVLATILASLLQVLDGLTAVRMMMALGPGSEVNPLVRSVYLAGGPAAVLSMKGVAATLIALTLWRLAGHGRVLLAGTVVGIAVVVGIVGCLSNL